MEREGKRWKTGCLLTNTSLLHYLEVRYQDLSAQARFHKVYSHYDKPH